MAHTFPSSNNSFKQKASRFNTDSTNNLYNTIQNTFWVRNFKKILYLEMFRLTNTMENVTVPRPVTRFPAFYDTYSLITTFKRSPLHVPVLSQINPVPVLPSFFFKIHLLSSSHLYPGLPKGFFPSSFSTKTLNVFYFLYTWHMPNLSHPPSFDHRNNVSWWVKFKRLFIM